MCFSLGDPYFWAWLEDSLGRDESIGIEFFGVGELLLILQHRRDGAEDPGALGDEKVLSGLPVDNRDVLGCAMGESETEHVCDPLSLMDECIDIGTVSPLMVAYKSAIFIIVRCINWKLWPTWVK